MKLRRVVSSHDGAVSEVDGCTTKNTFVAFAALSTFYGCGARRLNHLPIFQIKVEVFNQKLYPLNRFFVRQTHDIFAPIAEIPPNNFLFGSFLCRLIVYYGKSSTIDPHIRWGFVKRFAIHNFFQYSFQNREHLNVTIVVDRLLIISFQMKRVY